MKMWQGRFKKEEDERVNDFNSSISFDSRMYKQDITGSMAHAKMLGDTGIIETSYGVHVMYFDSFGKIYRDALVENALRSADYNAWYDATAGDGSYTTSAFGMKYTTK